ncbi:MAG: hypothetical protein AB1439_03010 [candidate division FCPU426 bacterium]
MLALQLQLPAVWAATTVQENVPPKRAQVSILNIALFYAGVIGAVIGACTGWVNWIAAPRWDAPQNAPLDEPELKPTPKP